jgi:hypothetical protein
MVLFKILWDKQNSSSFAALRLELIKNPEKNKKSHNYAKTGNTIE